MTTSDRTLTCADCGQEFVFTGSEQQFFADRQFSEPRRCPSCRAVRKLSRGGSGDPARSNGGYSGGGYSGGGSREMFSTTCSSCGREARVPFQPTGSKPVYCSDCFTSQRSSYR
jgi:CxxC-x17-CxxC domain-containing protein